MASAFGEFLHSVRKRSKGTQIAKQAGISYVYLLDLEKGARPVPSNTVLMNLANNLSFKPGEREIFFDLAASENGNTPLDVSSYLSEHKELITLIREMRDSNFDRDDFRMLLEHTHRREEDRPK